MQNKRTILFLTGKYSSDVAEAVNERVSQSNDNLGIIVNQRELESTFMNFIDKVVPVNSKLRRLVRGAILTVKDTLSDKKITQTIGFKNANVLHSHIYNVLNRYTPDVVAVTSSEVLVPALSAIHKTGKNTKVVAICDNFVLDEKMLNRNVDRFFVDNFDIRNKLIAGGIAEDKIEITPLALKRSAQEEITKEDAVKKLGLDESKKTILINTSCDDRFKTLINALSEAHINANVVVACQSNVNLLNLARDKGFNAYNEGINIHAAISASDLVITRPEPTFIAECVYKKKLIFGVLPLTPKEGNTLDYLGTDTIVKIENEKELVEKASSYISDLEAGSYTGYEEIFSLLEQKEFVDSAQRISDFLIGLCINERALKPSTHASVE
ncbi:MAG TPA: hypothetical protein PKY53_04805 [Clostridia bacterium]|mgnify:CR=1 FL=1|nr:hypothetical protein [Clostridia bacterium]